VAIRSWAAARLRRYRRAALIRTLTAQRATRAVQHLWVSPRGVRVVDYADHAKPRVLVKDRETTVRRRLVWTTAALAVLLVLPAAPATAAQSTLVTPDGAITKATPIEIEMERDFGAERISEVHATLTRDGEALGMRLQLECVGGCDPTDQVVRFALPNGEMFDPATGEPFGAEGPLANGTYVLEVELLKNSRFQSDEEFQHELVLSVRPTAPKDVAAEVDGDEVALTWTPSPEPDVENYRIERHDGDDWQTVTTTTEPTAVDEPGEGEHRYRVVAERPDGRDGTVERASEEVTVEVVVEEEDDEEDREESDEDEEERESEESEDAEVESQDGNGNGNGGDQDTSNERRNRSGGSADAPSTGNGNGGIPGIDGNGDADEGYSTELDYGDMGDTRAGDDVEIATPSGWRGTVDRIFDAEQVAVPIAAGLVMTAAGLHLWRWLRVPV
jgi:hypothetical protein